MGASLWSILLSIVVVAAAVAAPRTAAYYAKQTDLLYQPRLCLGHTQPITVVAWSPDGRTLATGSQDHTVVLWNRATWRPRATLTGYTAPISALAWSPDGKWLAATDQEHTAVIWDARLGKRHAVVRSYSVSWSPDGRTFAGAAYSHVVLWDADTGKPRLLLKTRDGYLAWSPDGRTLATGAERADVVANLWDVRTGRRRAVLRDAAWSFTSVLTWSPDGKRIAAADNGRVIVLWDLVTGRHRILLPNHNGAPYGSPPLAWSPDGTLLATGKHDQDDVAIIWNAATGRQQTAMMSPNLDVQALSWSPNGKTLAVSGYGCILWNPYTGEMRSLHYQAGGPVAWSPDSRLFTSGGPHDTLSLRDGRTGSRVAALPSPVTRVSRLAWSPDGKSVAAGSDEPFRPPEDPDVFQTKTFVRVWDTTLGKPRLAPLSLWDGKPRDTLLGYPDSVYDLAWSPDGTTLATTAGQYGQDSSLPIKKWLRSNAMLWDPATGARKAILKVAAGRVVWSLDGSRLATWSQRDGVALWDVNGGCLATVPSGLYDWWLTASADDRTVAILGTPGSGVACVLIDVPTRSRRATIAMPQPRFYELALNPSGSTLAAAADDWTVSLWDTVSGHLDRTLTLRHPRYVLGTAIALGVAVLAWSPDGKLFATGSTGHGLVKLWNAASGQLCAILSSPNRGVSHLRWSPDGKTLACVYENQTVVLWDLATRSRRATLRGHTGTITDLAWSPSGRTIATSSEDGSLRLWSAATGKEQVAFYSPDEGKEWLAVTPDGYFAASPHGADYLRWQRGAKLWTVRQLRYRFERLDIIRKRLAQ